MKIKSLIGLCFILSSTIGVAKENHLNQQALAQKKYTAISEKYENAFFKRFPEQGLALGRSDVDLNRFSDNSYASLSQWNKKEKQFLNSLNQINEDDLKDNIQRISYLLLKENLSNHQASLICHEELWNVNPLSGIQNEMPMIADKQPVHSKAYQQMAIKRWQQFPKVIDNQINNLNLGLRQGYSAPKPAVKRVIDQLTMMTNTPINESPFYSLAERSHDPHFRKEISAIIKEKINPSLTKYAEYLKKTYYPRSRKAVGVWANPNGEACYLAKIKQETTLAISPQQIHDIGLNKIQSLSIEIKTIGNKLYGLKEVNQIFSKANAESEGYFSNEQEMIDYNMLALKNVKAKINQWFDITPVAEGVIRPYPIHMSKNGAPGEYWAPNNDTKQPGIFYLNTYQPHQKSRVDQEATLFHELIPGHHFQVAVDYENLAQPSINKYLWNSGFGEGWALYAERLADEMGLYRDEQSRLGMLSNESLRAARLVVDSGMHAFHWTREQAVDYLRTNTGVDENTIQGEVDRYIMTPGQANSYMLGKIEIENLRSLAKNKLGHKFDIRTFHNHVLKNGTLTLPILRMKINEWITSSQG